MIYMNFSAMLFGLALVPFLAEANEENTEIKFDKNLLMLQNKEQVNVDKFQSDDKYSLGDYNVDIYINNEFQGRRDITVAKGDSGKNIVCLNYVQFKELPLNFENISSDLEGLSSRKCIDILSLIAGSELSFDGAGQLDITIPQKYVSRNARGSVPPSMWEDGVNGALLGYDVNYYSSKSKGYDVSRTLFGNIRAGVNVGDWYLRHNGGFNQTDDLGSDYTLLNLYLQHDISSLGGTARIGQINTSGQVYETLPIKGVTLESDDRMLPLSQRGYAPEVRGVARTNARVIIKQLDRVIYETTVTPGAFVINELYPTGYGGDLDVTVKEADGNVQRYKVPFSSVNQLLRLGQQKYEVALGRYDSSLQHGHQDVLQVGYQRGLSNILTGYTGLQLSQGYQSMMVGSALGTPFGAFSFDVSGSSTKLDSDDVGSLTGQSYKIGWNKFFLKTGTNVSIASYRFSTEQYLDFKDAASLRDMMYMNYSQMDFLRKKSRASITISQGLPSNLGQLYVTGYSQNYWNKSNTDLQYQLGYSNHIRDINFSINAGKVKNLLGQEDTNVFLNVSMPIGLERNHSLTMALTDTFGRRGQQLGLSGVLGDEQEYSYSSTLSHYDNGVGNSGTLNGRYRAAGTSLNTSYGHGANYNSYGIGMSGAVLGYAGGVVFSPYNGDNFAIIKADDAEGARVGQYNGIRINSDGLAATPYLSPYEVNTLSIDPKGISQDIELDTTTRNVIPRDGAISLVTFKANSGIKIAREVVDEFNRPLPFGAEVYDMQDNLVGYIGQAGQLYARVKDESGKLTVKWDNNHQCGFYYSKNNNADNEVTTCVQ
ncbi:MAG: fimbria/pilus outer membrane usher protein [Aeromonas hydrophila]